MDRTTWTDERSDDLASSMDRSFALVHEELRALRGEMTGLRGEMTGLRGEMTGLRGDVMALHRQLAQIGWALAAGMFGTAAAVVIALVA
jgi:predicted  nucleic acid-binding Zn-ribbon protein